MFSRHIIRFSAARRIATRIPVGVRFYNPEQKGDVGDQAHEGGLHARQPGKASPMDAASPETGKQASRGGLSGNKEGVGFADQVGSQTASGSNMSGKNLGKPESGEGFSGKENITPPSFADAVKNKLGLGTSAGEDKQNRGGGKGVTGTGTFPNARSMHTSAVRMLPARTQGQAPDASRRPKERTEGDQNAHLKHKKDNTAPDSGKGNAGKDPKLPSHQVCSLNLSWGLPCYLMFNVVGLPVC